MVEYVSLKSLAAEIGLDRSNCRKYLHKLGVKPVKMRLPDSGNQPALALTQEQADAVRRHRQENGYVKQAPTVSSDTGLFYVVQLVPDLDPRRIKLGFAADLTDLLAQHRTAAPTAMLLRSWRCRRSWESTVMDCLSLHHCRLISSEVFECDDLPALLVRAERWFAVMLDPQRDKGLAECSPMGKVRQGS